MSTITREQLHERAREKVKSLEFAVTQTAFADSRAELEEELELARIALASLEAEAVGEVIEQQSGMMMDGLVISEKPTYRNIKGIHKMKMMPLGTKFYTAPPAPANAEPVAWLWSHRKHPREVTLVRPEDDEKAEAALWSGWSCQALCAAPPAPVSVPDGYRLQPISEYDAMFAAMLQGAEPVQVWIPCSERMPQKNERVIIFINFNSETVPPSIHDAQFTGSTFRRGNATVNVFPLEDGYGVTHWMPLPEAPKQGSINGKN